MNHQHMLGSGTLSLLLCTADYPPVKRIKFSIEKLQSTKYMWREIRFMSLETCNKHHKQTKDFMKDFERIIHRTLFATKATSKT